MLGGEFQSAPARFFPLLPAHPGGAVLASKQAGARAIFRAFSRSDRKKQKINERTR